MHALTDAAACAKGEEVPRLWIGVRYGFGEGMEVVCVSIGLETAGVWVAGRV